jgi:hypothetical protein
MPQLMRASPYADWVSQMFCMLVPRGMLAYFHTVSTASDSAGCKGMTQKYVDSIHTTAVQYGMAPYFLQFIAQKSNTLHIQSVPYYGN